MNVEPIDHRLGNIDFIAAKRRWIVLALAWTAYTVSGAGRFAWGSVAIPVSQSLGLPIAALGIFVTASSVGYVASNVVGGFAADIFGSRIALTISLAGLALATFGFGYAPSLTVGLTLQALMGFMAGADISAGIKLVSVCFPQHERGRAIGLLMTGSSSTVIITNAIFPSVVAAFGWRNAYQSLGVAILIIAVLCGCFIPDIRTAERIQPQAGAADLLLRVKPIVTANFIFLAIAGCGGLWGTVGFMAWAIPLMAKGHDLTAVQAGFVVAIAGIAGLFSKPSIGWLSDRLGGRRKELLILSFAFFATVLMVFGQLNNLTAFQIAAPLIGIGAFVYSPLLVAMVVEGAGPRLAGSAGGIANAMWQLGSAMGPAAVGIILQRTGSFSITFATLAAGPLVALAAMLFVREDRDLPRQDQHRQRMTKASQAKLG